ncbi:helix-turn-helix domain-containing protein [Tumebacillus permanentifrigoris]|uniref:helix-turn-helix domain-containing protein n=1 Tax=Tumebacillus permanentifrigoris TaxID=378543 RepID=UPI000D6B54F1
MSTPLHKNQETLGARVKRLRIERELSQEKVADFCGVTNGWISKLEKDKFSPRPNLSRNWPLRLKFLCMSFFKKRTSEWSWLAGSSSLRCY